MLVTTVRSARVTSQIMSNVSGPMRHCVGSHLKIASYSNDLPIKRSLYPRILVPTNS